jgi:hypothetical protein
LIDGIAFLRSAEIANRSVRSGSLPSETDASMSCRPCSVGIIKKALNMSLRIVIPSGYQRIRVSQYGRLLAGCFVLVCVFGCGPDAPDPADFAVTTVIEEPERAPCAHRSPRGLALFGDLHVHTALSTDAWNYDLEVRPSGAYSYAFGGEILLPPNDSTGRGTRPVRIDRPLDFAAVTDHAEFLGETILCTTPGSFPYDTSECQEIREATAPTDSPLGFKIMNPFSTRDENICGDDLALCAEALDLGWKETIAAAEDWNDTSVACDRTAFIAYEYSSFRMGSNLHRNVIFRGSTVPRRPVSYMDVHREWDLWELLDSQCNASGTGCRVLAIPHNSNISNGRMFAVDYPGADSIEEQVARATLRIAVEPIVEIMQHKGDSECRRGLSSVMGSDDALCDFEKFENANFRRFGEEGAPDCYDGPLADWKPNLGPSCLSRLSYVRYALTEGLAEEARIGVNPFKFGLMASTDTHNAMAGGVEEKTWPGHLGIADGTVERRLDDGKKVMMGNYSNGPGGLIGVWAEENTRGAIFDAMSRKEVFGTSGPRIAPRLYAGWDLPEDLCAASDVLGQAMSLGVPMGSDLPKRTGSRGPGFAVWAGRDVGTEAAPGGLLQRIQVIKGWIDSEGVAHEGVIDIAGGENGAGVDSSTCEPTGTGHVDLCGVWHDPDFDPAQRAVYYARIVENPSCRYSGWQCLEFSGDDRPTGCDDPLMSPVQQERAWTSPVWYTPEVI